MNKRLYFIALLPPPELSKKITGIKREFASKYHCQHALKILPHITLQAPFMRQEESEVELFLSLQQFFRTTHPFEISLKNYGCFNKKSNRVLFINVQENSLLKAMQNSLITHLKNELKFSEREITSHFHPHVTIAFRDLLNEEFEKAWPVYREKFLEDNFEVLSAFLLRHNFFQWEVIGEFPF
ncbi:MAG: 2'-5' RNA ligase family protein [Bacteroidetes bacterium]|nr:2'-5' RNA ligase family protein [Bacteroidota bacterium]